MPASVVASGSIPPEAVSTASRTVSLPAVQDGDWLVLGVSYAGGSTTVASDGGVLAASPTATSSRSGFSLHVWAAEVESTDSGSNITLTTSSSIKAAVVYAIYRGVDSLTATDFTNAAAATPVVGPAFTPATDKVLVQVVAQASTTPASSWTVPSNMAERVAQTTGGTSARATTLIADLLSDGVATDSSWTPNVTATWGVVSVELHVAAPVDPGTDPVVTVVRTVAGFDFVPQAVADTTTDEPPAVTATVGSGSTSPGSSLVAPDDARLRYVGAGDFDFGTGTPDSSFYYPSSRYPNAWGNPPTYGVRFVHTGSSFEVLFKYYSSASFYRITVDGRRATDRHVLTGGTAGGSSHTLRFAFGSVATRNILIEFYYVPFGGVYVPVGQSLASAPAMTQRAIFEGDSITGGSDFNTAGSGGTWYARFAKYAQIDDPWNVAIGGTGFVAPGSQVNIPDRIADVTSYDPQHVFVWAGGNDGASSVTSVASSYFAALKVALPSAHIYAVGTWSPAVSPSANRAARSLDIKAAALANHIPFVSPITGEVLDGEGVLIASQGPWISTSGQVADYVNPVDNTHPTDAGHEYIARRMLQAWSAITEVPAVLTIFDGSTEVPGTVELL